MATGSSDRGKTTSLPGAPRATIEARVELARGGFRLSAEFEVPERGVTGLFGPSGAGKTTVLRWLAGLERRGRGRLVVDGGVWQDSASGRFVPPHRRGVGYVFQEADLFPHLDVRGNLRFGLRRTPPAERRVGWDEAVRWTGLEGLLGRRPEGLSGGERQRVAIARALLAGPRLLLMDEPLSALDEGARAEILPILEALPPRLSIPIVYVTHSLVEIARLSDHLVWLVEGAVRAQGPAREVIEGIDWSRAPEEEVAVLLEGRVARHDERFRLTLLESPLGPVWVRYRGRAPGTVVRFQVLAGDVSLARSPDPGSSILNEFRVHVLEGKEGAPGEMLTRLGRTEGGPVLLARLTRRSWEALGLRPGVEVFARVKSVALVD